MTLTQNVDPDLYTRLTKQNFQDIGDYIDAPMTATTFSNLDKRQNSEKLTSEIIYYWMISLHIPFECQKWHLNRLLTLIKVCAIKNQPPKKMGKQATMRSNARLNAARKAAMRSRG